MQLFKIMCLYSQSLWYALKVQEHLFEFHLQLWLWLMLVLKLI